MDEFSTNDVAGWAQRKGRPGAQSDQQKDDAPAEEPKTDVCDECEPAAQGIRDFITKLKASDVGDDGDLKDRIGKVTEALEEAATELEAIAEEHADLHDEDEDTDAEEEDDSMDEGVAPVKG